MSTKRKINSRRPAGAPRPWIPMRPAERVPWSEAKTKAFRAEALARGMASEEIDQLLDELDNAELWINDQYVVTVTRWENGDVQELSIRREDRRAVHDWRDFQRIKTEIAGAHVEAVELYPDEDRLMDTANQYYLYCLPPGERFPMGYVGKRNIAEQSLAGSGQRPLPEDWK
jgi:hypothetical protein